MSSAKSTKARYFLLIDLLQSFSKEELHQFTYFVASPYFNTDKKVEKLLLVLKKKVVNKHIFDDSMQAKIYKEVFDSALPETDLIEEPHKKFLRAKMNLLAKLAQRFLKIEALEENPVCQEELLSKKLLEKKQFLLIERLQRKHKAKLDTINAKNLEHYDFAFQLEMTKMNYLHQKGIIVQEDNFPKLINCLDTYYLILKLQLYSTMYSIANITKKSYDFTPLDSIALLLRLPQHENNPLILLYQTIIQLMKNPSENSYLYLLELLDQYEHLLANSYLIDFYGVAINFCSRQIRMGKVAYNKKSFELYRRMENKGILMEKEFVQIVNLTNIISVSCHAGEFKWASEIVNKYCPLVEKKNRNSVYRFNLGAIEFYKKNYKAAIKHLIRVGKVSSVYDTNSRSLLLKSYYQLDKKYDERTIQIFQSAIQYFNNQATPLVYKKSYKNFGKILINLYKVRHQTGKATLEKIYDKMQKMDVIASKKWLLEKIEELGYAIPKQVY